ncbi:hypothetical protein GGI42DRAFT_88797 [Trichoderma sp. SZMC 28013]
MPEPTPPVWSGLVWSGLRIFFLFSSSRPPCFPRPFLIFHLRRSVSISPSLSLSLSSRYRYTQNSGPCFFFPYPPSTVSYRIVLLLAVLTGATWLRTGHYFVSARFITYYILYCILLLPIMVITASSA